MGLHKFAKFKKTNLHRQFRAKKYKINSDEDQKIASSSPDIPPRTSQRDHDATCIEERLTNVELPKEKAARVPPIQ